MVVYMMDYYLPQILPHDKGTTEDIGILAAPIHFDPMDMKMHYVRRDDEFLLYRFVNFGGYQFVMTRADVPKCSDPMEYVTRHYGKPLDNGRLIAIRFSPKDTPRRVCTDHGHDAAQQTDWLKASSTGARVKDKGFGNTLYKCNPREFELAVLESHPNFCTQTPGSADEAIPRACSLASLSRSDPRKHRGQRRVLS